MLSLGLSSIDTLVTTKIGIVLALNLDEAIYPVHHPSPFPARSKLI